MPNKRSCPPPKKGGGKRRKITALAVVAAAFALSGCTAGAVFNTAVSAQCDSPEALRLAERYAFYEASGGGGNGAIPVLFCKGDEGYDEQVQKFQKIADVREFVSKGDFSPEAISTFVVYMANTYGEAVADADGCIAYGNVKVCFGGAGQ